MYVCIPDVNRALYDIPSIITFIQSIITPFTTLFRHIFELPHMQYLLSFQIVWKRDKYCLEMGKVERINVKNRGKTFSYHAHYKSDFF